MGSKMTDKETLELFKRAKAGDQRAKADMVLGYLPVARSLVVRAIRSRIIEEAWIEDVLADCEIAILLSIDDWDPDKGKFTTHIYKRVFKAIESYANSVRKFHGQNTWQDKSDRFFNKMVFFEDRGDFAESNWDDGGKIVKEESCRIFLESGESILEAKEAVERLKEGIDQLSRRRRFCILNYYGLFGHRPMTRNEIASILLIEPRRVRTFIEEAKKTLMLMGALHE